MSSPTKSILKKSGRFAGGRKSDFITIEDSIVPRRGEEEFLIEPFDVNKAKGLQEEGTLRVSDLGSCANLVT